jgi:hypothetical protein
MDWQFDERYRRGQAGGQNDHDALIDLAHTDLWLAHARFADAALRRG